MHSAAPEFTIRIRIGSALNRSQGVEDLSRSIDIGSSAFGLIITRIMLHFHVRP